MAYYEIRDRDDERQPYRTTEGVKGVLITAAIGAATALAILLAAVIWWGPTVKVVHINLPTNYVEIIHCRDHMEDVRVFGDAIAFSLIDPADVAACYDNE